MLCSVYVLLLLLGCSVGKDGGCNIEFISFSTFLVDVTYYNICHMTSLLADK
jgi:Ni,Fe-hydrogenase III small subunit